MKLFRRLRETRLFALVRKEINQILRNKQLIFLLLFPPTVQLLIFGLVLNPEVDNLSLGVVDFAKTQESRELVAALTENKIFWVKSYEDSQADLERQVETGNITTGLVIPPDFNRNLADNKTAEVQVFIDGIDANTAGIAQGYISQIVREYSLNLLQPKPEPLITPQVTFLYNHGLQSSWFFVPGVMGMVLTLTGSMISCVTLIKEKDIGTLEQLLMTPASAWEILLAKIIPLFVLVLGDVLIASSIGLFVFHLPFRGSIFLFFGLSALYVFVCIGLGMLLATLVRTQQQVVLISFFFNVPIIQLSGAIAPIDSMPEFFKVLSFFDPLRHYVEINRNLILKGVGLEVVWPDALALLVFAIVLLSISTWRFREQLN